jgi:glutamate dehydrogenase/leucine dehydrogenase
VEDRDVTDPDEMLEGLCGSEHEDIVVVRRAKSGLHAIIAVHSTLLGPSLGGARFYPYRDEALALDDVLRLSRAMTEKAALAGLAQGGGKAVILGGPGVVKTPALLHDFAAAVDSLGGRYITAEDVGTTQADMDLIRDTTPFVAGTSVSRGGSGDPSPATARGIVVAMEAAARHRWGTGLEGRTALVLGAGKVGGEVVRLLVERHVDVIASDTDGERVAAALRAGAVRSVDPADAPGVAADILCPCALGGLLTDELVPGLRVEIVVGAANNQLAHAGVADTLAAAGILYVPDFLANAGGIINIAEEARGYDPAAASTAVDRIGETTTNVLERADMRGVTPLAAAEQLVAERLDDARERLGLSVPRARTADTDGLAASRTTRQGMARGPVAVPEGATAPVKRAARLPS